MKRKRSFVAECARKMFFSWRPCPLARRRRIGADGRKGKGKGTNSSFLPRRGDPPHPQESSFSRGLLIFGGGRGRPRRDVSGDQYQKCLPRSGREPHGEKSSGGFFWIFFWNFFGGVWGNVMGIFGAGGRVFHIFVNLTPTVSTESKHITLNKPVFVRLLTRRILLKHIQ